MMNKRQKKKQRTKAFKLMEDILKDIPDEEILKGLEKMWNSAYEEGSDE